MANSKIEWKVIAESIAMMAIVLSLVFVGLQLKQSQVIARNEIDGLFLENRIEAVGQINDHVNVWVRGLAAEKQIFGVSVKTTSNRIFTLTPNIPDPKYSLLH